MIQKIRKKDNDNGTEISSAYSMYWSSYRDYLVEPVDIRIGVYF